MRSLFPSAVVFVAFLVATSLAQGEPTVEGRWHTPEREGTVMVEISEGVLTGTLVESTKEKAKLGTVILRDFVRSGSRWKGKIYVPKRDRVADAELSLSEDTLTIKVSAGLRSQSIVWTRVPPSPTATP